MNQTLNQIRNKPVTANQLSGRATGALFFAFFGAIWIVLALYAREILTAMNLIWVGLNLAALLAVSLWLFRQAKRFPKVAEDPAMRSSFNRINGIQWAAVFVVAFTFTRLHIDAYVMCAITGIVGLHMFPLARLFRYPMHYATGAILTGWAMLSAIFVPLEHLQGTTALGTGIILWLSAYITLMLAAALARHTRPGADSYSVETNV